MIYSTPVTEAFLRSRELTDEFVDLSASDIEKMPMSEWAKRTGRQVNVTDTVPAPSATVIADAVSHPGPRPDPQGVSLDEMDMQQYAAFRAQAGIGQGEYGRGILSTGGESWSDAASRKSGRSALNESNVTPPARVDGDKYLQANLPVQGRAEFYRGA